jgi:release factor glutamine methyltransferase
VNGLDHSDGATARPRDEVIAQLRDDVIARLRAAGCVFAEDEADVLFATTSDPERLDELVSRRATGVPLEHVVGWAQFAGIRLVVHPGVFVPRQRTEALVRSVVAVVAGGATVVDLCCGSGAIAAAIATAVPGVRLWASDVDPVAVSCARENLAPFGAQVIEADLDAGLPGALHAAVDVLVANVPYVPSDDIDFLPAEARLHEARSALDGGDDGLALLRRVAGCASRWLRPGGWLFSECAIEQAPAAVEAVGAAGLSAGVQCDDDLEVAVVTGRRAG